MSEYGEEGQGPEGQAPGPAGEIPARPTVRESLRRGLFVRLPTEGESGEGLPGQPADEAAETYEGWRQTADGGWEPVSPEAQAYYAQAYEPPPPEPYPETADAANFASVAGGEPFFHDEQGQEAAGWSFGGYQGAAVEPAPEAIPAPPAPETPAAELPAEPAIYGEAAVAAEAAPEPAPEPAPEVVPEAPADYLEQPAAQATADAPAEPEPAASPEAPEPAAAAVPTPTATGDPVAATGVYIPPDVELLEGDMPLYSEKDKVAPIFKGEGLGEPLFVDFADLPEMLTGLRRLLPPKTRLTYNYDYERAWVRASKEIDLVAIAEQVKAAPPVST